MLILTFIVTHSQNYNVNLFKLTKKRNRLENMKTKRDLFERLKDQNRIN